MSPEDALGFWFGRKGDEGYGGFREEWFRKDAAFDEEIRERFLGLYEEAASGKHDDWRVDARGAVALVIVLDQFHLNMFRGDPWTVSNDELVGESE